MTPAEFFEWVATQEYKHELVDGQPVLREARDRRHNEIVRNATLAFGRALQSSGHYRLFSSQLSVWTPAGNVRLCDLGVDAGPFSGGDMWATAPALLFEVLPSTNKGDYDRRIEELKAIETLRHLVLVDPDRPRMFAHSRSPDGSWVCETFDGLNAAIEMPDLALTLKLIDLYGLPDRGDQVAEAAYEYTVSPERRVISISDDVINTGRLIEFARELERDLPGCYGNDNLYGEPGNCAEWTFELGVRGSTYSVEIVKLRREAGFTAVVKPLESREWMPSQFEQTTRVLSQHLGSQLPNAHFLIGLRPGEVWFVVEWRDELDSALLQELLDSPDPEVLELCNYPANPHAKRFCAVAGHAFEIRQEGGLVLAPQGAAET